MTVTRRVGDIADVFNGKTPAKADQRVSGFPVLKIKDVNARGQFSGEFESFVDDQFAQRHKAKCLRTDDILVLNAAHNADYVGSKQYLAERSVEGSLATGEWLIARSKSEDLNQRYLWHWFQSSQTRFKLKKIVKGIHLYPKDVADQLITLPPIEEQRRIAAILDKADAIHRKQCDALELQERQIKSLFVHSVGPNANGYARWEKKPIRDLALSKKGAMRTGPFGSDLKHSEFVDDGIAVLGIDNAVKNRFAWDERRFITEEKYLKLKRYQVFPGDVIITIMGTTGRSSVVPKDIPTAITTKHLATISLDLDKAEPEFISNAIHRHPALLSQIRSQNKGAIMAGLNLGIIKELEVPMPPIEVQREFTRSLGMLRQMHSKTENALLKAEEMLASLSQRAFRGEL
ncbi:restriction endonuclease subunit S [Thalassospira australica]|uniref:restriction endonuclease subunit S n=1 Tax=Thalassospira australica TaxID=1528106 RepID=UPI00384C28D6